MEHNEKLTIMGWLEHFHNHLPNTLILELMTTFFRPEQFGLNSILLEQSKTK